MSQHKPPRPVHPVTAPPPDPDAAEDRLLRKVERTRALVAVAVTLVLFGGAAAAYNHGLIHTDQLEQVRVGASTALAATSATTTAQLGALQATVQDLRMHQATVDATLSGMLDDMHWIRDQLTAVARATGAKPVPTP